MRTTIKIAAAATLAGILALGMATPSQARDGRNAAAAIGFGAGVVAGAAVANSYDGYYYGPTYRPYAYEPAPPAYVPAPGYYSDAAPAYETEGYAYAPGGCWVSTDNDRGYGYYGSCAHAHSRLVR